MFRHDKKQPKDQPAPKYHTKVCSRSSVDSPGARTLVFVASESFLSQRVRGGEPEGVRKHFLSEKVLLCSENVFRKKKAF